MSQRADQVAEELRKIISMILLQDIDDRRLGFLTVTHIEVTDDLRFGRIFYSVLGDEQQKAAAQAAIDEHYGEIKRLAVQRINLKFAMDIRFELDRTIEHSFKIDEILKKIKKEKPA